MSKLDHRLYRLVAFTLFILSAIATWKFYWAYSMIGFPDGSRTELDRFYEGVYPYCIGLSIAFVLLSLYCGIAMKKRNSHKLLALLFILFIAFLMTFDFSDDYFYDRLEHGQGG